MKAMTEKSSTDPPRSLPSANHRISSLEKKPESGGMPAMAAVAMAKVTKVTGILRPSPPIFWMSCSPDMAWMTLPAPRKRQALKKACVVTWKMATP